MTDEEIKQFAMSNGWFGVGGWWDQVLPRFRAMIEISEKCALERAAQLCAAAASGDAGEYASDLAAQIRALKGGSNVES